MGGKMILPISWAADHKVIIEQVSPGFQVIQNKNSYMRNKFFFLKLWGIIRTEKLYKYLSFIPFTRQF
jgi:hypothetical protein